MSDENEKDLERTRELYEFLQGTMPECITVRKENRPNLTPEQAWTVVWYLGNQYWQVTDRVEKCEVCGDLYHSWEEGDVLDYGKAPYHFCGNCVDGDEYAAKEARKPKDL